MTQPAAIPQYEAAVDDATLRARLGASRFKKSDDVQFDDLCDLGFYPPKHDAGEEHDEAMESAAWDKLEEAFATIQSAPPATDDLQRAIGYLGARYIGDGRYVFEVPERGWRSILEDRLRGSVMPGFGLCHESWLYATEHSVALRFWWTPEQPLAWKDTDDGSYLPDNGSAKDLILHSRYVRVTVNIETGEEIAAPVGL